MSRKDKLETHHNLPGGNPAYQGMQGRRKDTINRRRFLGKSGLAAVAAALGVKVPFLQNMPSGLLPALWAASPAEDFLRGKEDLILLSDRPINAETPAHLLDDDITPANRMFVRNNGTPPATETIDPEGWALEIAGEACKQSRTFTVRELKGRFQHHTYQLQMECGGNGRSEFNPPARGNQWAVGAIACPQWTGVRLKDVLEACGIAENAVYVGYYGADRSLGDDPAEPPISRGVPMAKALQDETLVAWAMNGEAIPAVHGFPLRLVAGGWPASACGKWLNKLVIRDRVHDGPKMTGQSYRVPCKPVAPGTEVPDEDMCIIESMPVKSVITRPKSGIVHPFGGPLEVSGHAWAGDFAVDSLYVSIDFGATWQRVNLKPPVNRLAWQRWAGEVVFPGPGYYEIWARAVDSEGRSQPVVLPGWNPRGYLNNACHRIAVQAAA